MPISGLVKDVVKYVSQKEVIWNEEWDNIFYKSRKDLNNTYGPYSMDHIICKYIYP